MPPVILPYLLEAPLNRHQVIPHEQGGVRQVIQKTRRRRLKPVQPPDNTLVISRTAPLVLQRMGGMHVGTVALGVFEHSVHTLLDLLPCQTELLHRQDLSPLHPLHRPLRKDIEQANRFERVTKELTTKRMPAIEGIDIDHPTPHGIRTDIFDSAFSSEANFAQPY